MADCCDCGQICGVVQRCGTVAPLTTAVTVEVIEEGTGSTGTTCTPTGVVTALTLVNQGTGYAASPPPAVTISGGGGGAGAAVHAVVSGGKVTGLVIDSGGAGYTSNPTVSIAPPPSGTTATATATATLRCCIKIARAGNHLITAIADKYLISRQVLNATCSTNTVVLNLQPTEQTATVQAQSPCDGSMLVGVNVQASGNDGSTTSGTTGADGICTLKTKVGVIYTVTCTHPRFTFKVTGTFTQSACTPGSVIFAGGANIVVAPDYVCIPFCALPLSKTLTLSESLYGGGVVTWIGGQTWSGPGPRVSTPALENGCPAKDNVQLTYTVSYNGNKGVMATGGAFSNTGGLCPCDMVADNIPLAGHCVPAVGASASIDLSVQCTPGGGVIMTGTAPGSANSIYNVDTTWVVTGV